MDPLFIILSAAVLRTFLLQFSFSEPFCDHAAGFEYDPGAKAIFFSVTLVCFACINSQMLFRIHLEKH